MDGSRSLSAGKVPPEETYSILRRRRRGLARSFSGSDLTNRRLLIQAEKEPPRLYSDFFAATLPPDLLFYDDPAFPSGIPEYDNEYQGRSNQRFLYVFAEKAERLLCLEYLSNGSLDKYLSDESSGLDWSTCYNIIKEICHGLSHLHEQIDKPIIHLDLKPANILLDDTLVPKITDFGMSRLFSQQQTICTSPCVGTFGYMAPEFLHGGIITPKLDIFNLGVIIMEIITGHRDYPSISGTTSDDFIEHALEKWRNVLKRSPRYESLEADCHQIKRCIQVGLICVNPDRTKRPPIAKIINMILGSENIDCNINEEAA